MVPAILGSDLHWGGRAVFHVLLGELAGLLRGALHLHGALHRGAGSAASGRRRGTQSIGVFFVLFGYFCLFLVVLVVFGSFGCFWFLVV